MLGIVAKLFGDPSADKLAVGGQVAKRLARCAIVEAGRGPVGMARFGRRRVVHGRERVVCWMVIVSRVSIRFYGLAGCD